MEIIQDNEKLDKILERFYNRFNKYNTKVLQKLGNTIKQFDGVSPSDAQRIAQELKYNYQINDLLNELSQISGKSIQEIDKLFDEVAKENIEFAETYYKAKNIDKPIYEESGDLQNLVGSIKKETDGLFTNIANSNNIGFTMKDNNGNLTYKPLTQVYNDLIDEASYNVSIGVQDYQSAMQNTIKQLADSGVKVHQEKLGYASGYNRRIDSSVRQDVLTGLRRINLDIQEQIGEELGADGVEISAHSPCAEDHLHIQGKQFTKKEFERINGDLERPIGEYNCRHFVFSVILGVQSPSYSKKQLNKYRNESLSKVNYNGKTYTKYEATQVQRQLETKIRKQKDLQIMAKASDNKNLIGQTQQEISRLTNQYNNFSKKVGLHTYKNRLRVSGYKRMDVSSYKADKVIKASDTILQNIPDYGNIGTVIPKGVKMTNVRVIAGYNTSTPIKNIVKLTDTFPDNPQIWQKKVGTVNGKSNDYEIHWYENGTQQFWSKIKRVKK